MATFTNTSKNSVSITNVSKNASTFSNTSKAVPLANAGTIIGAGFFMFLTYSGGQSLSGNIVYTNLTKN